MDEGKESIKSNHIKVVYESAQLWKCNGVRDLFEFKFCVAKQATQPAGFVLDNKKIWSKVERSGHVSHEEAVLVTWVSDSHYANVLVITTLVDREHSSEHSPFLFLGKLSDSEVFSELTLEFWFHLKATNKIVSIVPEMSSFKVVDILDSGPLIKPIKSEVNNFLDNLSFLFTGKHILNILVRTSDRASKIIKVLNSVLESIFFRLFYSKGSWNLINSGLYLSIGKVKETMLNIGDFLKSQCSWNSVMFATFREDITMFAGFYNLELRNECTLSTSSYVGNINSAVDVSACSDEFSY